MTYNPRSLGSGSFPRLTTVAVVLSLAVSGRLVSAADVAIPQLQAAAEKGSVAQEVRLADAYFVGHGVRQDVKMAAYWYQKAAESGDPWAQNEIGFFYQTGVGVPADLGRALHWYQLSAASGLVQAKVNLGVIYVWGIGVTKDEALAAQFFRDAAAKGSGVAASYLGDMYYFGVGMKRDRDAGEAWYATGVKIHDPMAEFNLGSLYSGSGDHPADLVRAAKLFRQSATAGFVPAMYSLGLLLTNHPELAKSSQEARPWLETAARAGFWKSSVVLGVLARDGRGTSRDLEAAYYHFQIAMLQGGEPAKHLLLNDLAALTLKLSAERKSALDSEADTWFQQHQLALAFVSKGGENRKRFPETAISVASEGIHAGQLVSPPPV
jgi:TPR repeat protein